jgi:thiol-disulfide isomerase/thioredoxin
MKTSSISLFALGALLTLPALSQVRLDDEVPPKDDPKEKVLEVGSEVPETLALTSIDGETIAFKGLRDKVVMVHFWSDRCPYEKHGNKVFQRLEKVYADNADVVMIGIDSNQNELGQKPGEDADYADFYAPLRKKWTELAYEHDLFTDHGNRLSDLFQAKSTPHCFVIDKKGVVRYAGALDDDPREQKGQKATNYVKKAIDAVLADERVEITETKPYGCSIKRG